MKIIVENRNKNNFFFFKSKKIVIEKNNIAIRIAGKVSRYIDESMNRAAPTAIGHVGAIAGVGVHLGAARQEQHVDDGSGAGEHAGPGP